MGAEQMGDDRARGGGKREKLASYFAIASPFECQRPV